jgi:hypothetical protein
VAPYKWGCQTKKKKKISRELSSLEQKILRIAKGGNPGCTYHENQRHSIGNEDKGEPLISR